MAILHVDLTEPLRDGMAVKFKAPCDCTEVTGFTISYPNETGMYSGRAFSLLDAHRNRLTGVGNLFLKDAYVTVLIDTKNDVAYIQNADTNGYLEGEFEKLRALHVDDGTGCFYRMVGNELEWINPPMVVGTEYRTTDRFAGKPVYTTITTYTPKSTSASATYVVPPTGTVDTVIRRCGWTNTGVVLPFAEHDITLTSHRNVYVTIHNDSGVKKIKCTATHGEVAVTAAETWYIQLWYTKE